MQKIFVAGIAGVLFASGLMVSGMVDPLIVQGFLDVLGRWRSDLLWVMVGALLVATPVFYWSKRIKKPFCADQLNWPSKCSIDVRLLCGAGIFGVGWGLMGICPAPALVQLSGFSLNSILFVIAMFCGFKLAAAIK